MKTKVITLDCPTCNGKGCVKIRVNTFQANMEIARKAAIALHKDGFSYAQIAQALGYTSKAPVAHLLKYKPKRVLKKQTKLK